MIGVRRGEIRAGRLRQEDLRAQHLAVQQGRPGGAAALQAGAQVRAALQPAPGPRERRQEPEGAAGGGAALRAGRGRRAVRVGGRRRRQGPEVVAR